MGKAKKIERVEETKNDVLVYALLDPHNGCVRYIGKSSDIAMRLRRHLKDARDGHLDHKSRWIAKLLRGGTRPELVILEECKRDNWKERECFWIQAYREAGADLTNATDGGDGFNPGPATRAKMSRAAIGRVPHNKGQKTSANARSKQSIAAKNRWARMGMEERQVYVEKMQRALTPEARSHSGWHHTEEAKQKIGVASMGRKPSEETRRKISKTSKGNQHCKGRKCSDKTRRKIAVAARSLSAEQVDQIRGLLKDGGLTQKAIAKLIGTSEWIVSDIKLGRTYAL